MNDFTGRIRPDEWQPPKGNLRTITAALDTAQYQMDMNHLQATKGEDPYSTFNLLMRRKAKVRASVCCCCKEVTVQGNGSASCMGCNGSAL